MGKFLHPISIHLTRIDGEVAERLVKKDSSPGTPLAVDKGYILAEKVLHTLQVLRIFPLDDQALFPMDKVNNLDVGSP